MIDLKEFVCVLPFDNLEIHEKYSHFCCPEWLPKPFANHTTPLKDMWNTPEAIEIRKSVMDGSYKYCNKKRCPFLANILKYNNVDNPAIKHINNLPHRIRKYYDRQDGFIDERPNQIQLSIDRTCNLKCPACRIDFIVNSKDENDKLTKRIDDIINEFGKDINLFYTSSTGEPLASPPFRNFLRNFDSNKFPMLQTILLHTNATLWNEKMWKSLSKIHRYVKTIEISIDAATKDTYENKVRVGGNWDELIDNLKFISTIKTIQHKKVSFVVQQTNYKEMEKFVDLISDIFGDKTMVYFSKLQDWGTFDEEKLNFMDVSNQNHPEYGEFLIEFNKVSKKHQVMHNLHDTIELTKTLF